MRRILAITLMTACSYSLAATCSSNNGGQYSLSAGQARYYIPKPYYDWTRYYAYAHGLEPGFLMALLWVESRYCQEAISPTGAIGLGQLMPRTAAGMGIDPRDPVHNIYGSARYLREMYDTFGDWSLAVAAYNAGPNNVRKYGGIPPFTETINHVNRVFATYEQLKSVK